MEKQEQGGGAQKNDDRGREWSRSHKLQCRAEEAVVDSAKAVPVKLEIVRA